MRTAFQARLACLDSDLMDLTEDVAQVVRLASQAAVQADLAMAEEALSRVVAVKDSAAHLVETAAHLMAREQPVAHDLRVLIGAQQLAGCAQWMARLAGDVAKMARRRYPRTVVTTEVRGVIDDMSTLAHAMARRVSRAIGTQDPTSMLVLQGMEQQMRHLHEEMVAIVRSPAWPHGVDSAVEITLLSQDYERFAGHALEAAMAVAYVATGVPQPRSIPS